MDDGNAKAIGLVFWAIVIIAASVGAIGTPWGVWIGLGLAALYLRLFSAADI